jgi:ferredoxin
MNPIDVTIDDKACVGCSLCVEECPTKVFEMKDNEPVPKVTVGKECFGCLSCSEICPATAIHHQNVQLSESYYHDPRAIELVEKLCAPDRTFNRPVDDVHVQKAVDDLGIRLLSVTSVLKQTLGQSLPSVGTMAGMSLASQLPRYQPAKSLEDALQLLVQIFSPAWAIVPKLSNENLTLTVTTCFVRDVCMRASIELGGDLCKLFSNYCVGYLSKIGSVRPKLTNVAPQQNSCVYTIKIY